MPPALQPKGALRLVVNIVTYSFQTNWRLFYEAQFSVEIFVEFYEYTLNYQSPPTCCKDTLPSNWRTLWYIVLIVFNSIKIIIELTIYPPPSTLYAVWFCWVFTLPATLYALHCKIYPLSSTSTTLPLRSMLYNLRSTIYALRSMLYDLHSTLYNPRSTIYPQLSKRLMQPLFTHTLIQN